MHAKIKLSALLFACAAFATGCHHDVPSNRFEGNGVKGQVAVVEDPNVVIDLPLVKVYRGTTYISGTVHRKAGVTGDLAGRIDIEFLDSEGQYIDGLPALCSPRNIPRDPGTPATYNTSYGYIPPAGATVRVHWVNHDTEVVEDMEQTGFAYNAGGHAGGHGGYGEATEGGHAPVASHTAGHGGYGSSFGSAHW